MYYQLPCHADESKAWYSVHCLTIFFYLSSLSHFSGVAVPDHVLLPKFTVSFLGWSVTCCEVLHLSLSVITAFLLFFDSTWPRCCVTKSSPSSSCSGRGCSACCESTDLPLLPPVLPSVSTTSPTLRMLWSG